MGMAAPPDVPPTFDRTAFQEALLAWWAENARDYPWRRTRDPYAVLIAEILLHRTRADQVRPIYDRTMERFPTIRDLARAPVSELQDLLRPLGLAWRVNLLADAARALMQRFDGEVPHDAAALQSLPGVGPYITAAVRCFAFGEADPILDTNTVRICGRILDIPVTDSARRSRRFRDLLQYLIDPDHPRDFNFALLDHGALVCISRNPRCGICPVRPFCAYGKIRVP